MLSSLFHPRSIAVVGASRDPRKVGHAILNNLIRFGYAGRILPVNPSGTEILGLPSIPRLSDADSDVDLAVIAVPARAVPSAIADCAAAGVTSAVVVSAGFKETGAEGTLLEEELKETAQKHGIRILGPNCLGVINTANDLNATFAAGMLPKGRIAFFSQSGALGIAILDWAIGNNIGFSKFISLGNKADLSEIDFIEYFADDPDTDIILGYIEDVVDGRRFLEAAGRTTKKKPIVLLKSGGTAAGARAASSHTGALAGSDTAFDAAFRQAGVIRARGIEDLFDTALTFSGGKLPAGDRLLIITNAGGPGILAADAAERAGVRLPQMAAETIKALTTKLPPNASLYNPVDLIGDATSERYAAALEAAVADPNVDGVLVILTPQAMTDVDATAELVIRTAKNSDKPVLASFMGAQRVRGAVERLKQEAVPNFPYPETAISAFRKLADQSAWRSMKDEELTVGWHNFDAAQEKVTSILHSGATQVGEDDAIAILSYYGFSFPRRGLALTSQEAAVVSASIGFPVVMKISSPDILHKTDVGGVKLNVGTPKEAEDAFLEITTNARRFMPQAFLKGVLISEMVRGGKEVILGVTHDRTFGHMIMFGLGGIYVEVLKDVSFRIAPLTRRDALAMVQEIRTVGLLRGARGERPADLEAIAENIVRLSVLVTDFPEIQELDINPLVVMEKGAVALDARIIFKQL
ncbi:MAG: acyl-CoA synthetase [Nitrospirae bacterium GWC2_57_13]|nr:MAG: acyl-CoA synthetase [Nitrospirae bacterium GWC2_57_13]OGW46833.1 MAG: acyl-CoA synthetase [Nitrospirae bacterium GWD2_57_8]